MTYCYTFNAEPDGIGIVTDTQLSRITDFGDIEIDPIGTTKIYSPAQRAAVVIAGKIKDIQQILDGCKLIFKQKDSKWFDLFVSHCKENFSNLCDEGIFSLAPPPASTDYLC